MQRSQQQIPTVIESEINITQFVGLNTFGPHADLKLGELRTEDNFDNYGDYIKSRRGSRKFIEDMCPDLDILSRVIFDSGDDEYAIIQQDNAGTSEFRSIKLEAGSLFTDVLNKTTLSDFTISSAIKADMSMSNGKVYIFHPAGNAILEFDSVNERFLKRKMGLPALQISSISSGAWAGGLKGKRCYGVELVYKDTSVSPDVDLIVSGPNRVIASTNPLFGEGRIAYTIENSEEHRNYVNVSSVLNDGTLITDAENDNWTHARLYRSEDITTATNTAQDLEGESEITGRPDELYQVQEMTKAAFLATESAGFYTFAVDAVLDDDIPFPLTVITESRLELTPMPAAETGVFHNNRIWASGVVGLAGPGGIVSESEIQSKIFYTPESDTKYSESIRSLNAIESDPGDGQKMKKLIPFREDLIGIKDGKTGRVRNADPNEGWTTEDEVVGIEDKEFVQYVPDVGICARVNDQKDFRIFGYDLEWRSTFAGMQISRPIRNVINQYDADDVDFLYINGKLLISGGKGEIIALAAEQQRGWSKYIYPFEGKSEAVFTFANGTRALVINGGQPVIEIEAVESNGDYVDTDYNVEGQYDAKMDLDIATHRFQDNNGRSLIEEKFVSIVAVASNKFTAQAYVNGKKWQGLFSFLLDPADYPDSALTETEYQGYEAYRAIGNYIHYEIHTYAPCTIYSIMLKALIQRGSIRPGFDPFQVLGNGEYLPPWTGEVGNIIESGTAIDTITESGAASDTITEDGP